MSGGHFDYRQHRMIEDAEEIKKLSCPNCSVYPKEITDKFAEAAHWIARSSDMMQLIDLLLSGDDGVETFLERWKVEVRKAEL